MCGVCSHPDLGAALRLSSGSRLTFSWGGAAQGAWGAQGLRCPLPKPSPFFANPDKGTVPWAGNSRENSSCSVPDPNTLILG